MRRADPLATTARSNPETVALSTTAGERTLTYAELDQLVATIATGLEQQELPEKRVGIIARPAIEFTAGVHAIWRTGATVVPLDPTLPIDRLRTRINRVSVDSIVTPATAPDGIEAITVDALREQGLAGKQSTAKWLEDHQAAVTLFTSGTTGQAIPIQLTWNNLLENAHGTLARLGILPEDRWVQCLSPAHMGGFAPIVRAVVSGTGLIPVSPEADQVSLAIERGNATGVSVIPQLLTRWQSATVPLHRLRVVLVGGDRTSPELVSDALADDISLHTTYGMTETASAVTIARPQTLHAAPGTVGWPIRGATVEIRSSAGIPCPPGDEGEVVISGPMVSDELFSEEEGDGFPSGDRGYLDERGRLYVTGRLDSRIVSGGVTVDLTIVERELANLAGVKAAAAIGVADSDWGERVEAAVVLDEASTATTPFEEALADTLRPAEQPRRIQRVSHLPRTPSGTVDRDQLRTQLEASKE